MPKPPRFHTKRRRSRLREMRWIAIAAVLVGASYLYRDRLSPPEPVSEVTLSFGLCGDSWAACVIDGDTVAIGQRRVRLTGYDAPEMDGACEAERVKAREARTALHTWLAKGRFTWTGGTEPPRDQYGRELREASRGGEALADHMIGAGLAEGSGWGAERVAWC